MEFPTIEVRYEHLNIGAEAYVGSGALPSLANFIFSITEVPVKTAETFDTSYYYQLPKYDAVHFSLAMLFLLTNHSLVNFEGSIHCPSYTSK